MKRLISKIANHVSPEMHEDVNKNVIDGERTLRRQTSESYLTAKKLVADNVISPTNENILTIMKDIDSGKYSDIGPYNENVESWNERTIELFKEKRILIASQLKKH